MQQVNTKNQKKRRVERVILRRGLDVQREKPLPSGGALCLSSGSVVSFQGDAIVNAANEYCQGGGGVDGAITKAGGARMAMERAQLPIVAGTDGVRCRTGDAVVTTAEGGQLSAIRCIHAVGPIYGNYASEADADLALRGAYLASMARAKEEVSGGREGACVRACMCACARACLCMCVCACVYASA